MLIHTLLSAAVGGLLKKLRVLQDHRGSHEMMQRECRCKNVKKKKKCERYFNDRQRQESVWSA